MRRGLLILGLLGLVCAQLAFGQNSPAITSVVDPYTGGTALCPGISCRDLRLARCGRKSYGWRTERLCRVPGDRFEPHHHSDPCERAARLGKRSRDPPPSGTTAPFPITLTEYAPVLINSASGSLMSPIHQNSGLPVTANVPANPGEIILVSAIGLGPTNPVVPTGTEAPPNVPTTATPSVSIGANAVSGATAVLAAGRIGIYQVTFAVPQGTPTGSYPLSLSIGGASSNSFTLFVGPAPAGPAIAAVLDYVSLSTSLCPGDLAILSGLNLSANSQVTGGRQSRIHCHAAAKQRPDDHSDPG